MSGPKHRKCRICNEYYIKYYEGKKIRGFDEGYYICKSCNNFDNIDCSGIHGEDDCVSFATIKWGIKHGWWIGKCGVNNLCILCRDINVDDPNPILCCRCLYSNEKRNDLIKCSICHGHTVKGSHGTKYESKWLCSNCHAKLLCNCGGS